MSTSWLTNASFSMLCLSSFTVFAVEAVKLERTIARIHGLGKIWQGVLNLPPSYTIEVISEVYDKMLPEDQERTLIHELMHIPGAFGGGFRPHKGYVERKNVEAVYKKLLFDRADKRQKRF